MGDSPSKPLSPAAFFGVIAAAVLLIGGIGFFAIAPRSPVAKPGTPPKQESPLHRWIKEKYAETGGDWNKLNPNDQARLMQAGQGNGKSLFESVGKPK